MMDARRSESGTANVLVLCDYRADMRNSRIGMVLESAGASLDLRAVYSSAASISMLGKDSGLGHQIDDIDTVYVKLTSPGRMLVLHKDGSIVDINSTNFAHPVSMSRLRPQELERVTLTVGKPTCWLQLREDEPVTCIVAVPSRTYNTGDIERQTQGRGIVFVLEAEATRRRAVRGQFTAWGSSDLRV